MNLLRTLTISLLLTSALMIVDARFLLRPALHKGLSAANTDKQSTASSTAKPLTHREWPKHRARASQTQQLHSLSPFINNGEKLTRESIQLRKFPYPYDAMLAITSDTDGMTLQKFELIHRFLNTKEDTPLGRGLGLDVGDSFFFFIGTDRPGFLDKSLHTVWQDQMSYFYRLSPNLLHDAKEIIFYSKVGWIDSLHSLGDFSMMDSHATLFQRHFAEIAMNALKENHLQYAVWINHGNESNVGNFGNPDSNYQQGDLPASPYYIADLMLKSGVKFIWTRRDSKFGERTMLYPIELRDGHKCWGFYRYTDDGYQPLLGVLWNWNPRQLHSQLSVQHLADLKLHHEYSIVAQHLGGNPNRMPFYGDNLKALIRLKQEYEQGHILVARTSRLLQYNEVQQYLHANVKIHDHHVIIAIDEVRDPVLGTYRPTLEQLRGITFYTPNPFATSLQIGTNLVSQSQLTYNPPDSTGLPSLSIKWWPADVTDYTKQAPHNRSHAQTVKIDKNWLPRINEDNLPWIFKEDHL
ncbi:hypothetical protein [Sulfoacidibacillus thermotolerans]|uniref:Uncharacterized protein n=1 Tax=Sulfoacidibacillus thermotolerans TaxID=1765684 RepID=A0A2U3D6I0_SULT2|nr:hypothetical protein [Sulfoacidibacillus thermotolerans]PWI56879.1 hypothetical protein BM613_11635 [Sulfoacidibacillus thermotolerans]